MQANNNDEDDDAPLRRRRAKVFACAAAQAYAAELGAPLRQQRLWRDHERARAGARAERA